MVFSPPLLFFSPPYKFKMYFPLVFLPCSYSVGNSYDIIKFCLCAHHVMLSLAVIFPGSFKYFLQSISCQVFDDCVLFVSHPNLGKTVFYLKNKYFHFLSRIRLVFIYFLFLLLVFNLCLDIKLVENLHDSFKFCFNIYHALSDFSVRTNLVPL